MSQYSCELARRIGKKYSLSPEQVTPHSLRNLAEHWQPDGRDLSRGLNIAAGRLERYLTKHYGPTGAVRPVHADEDGREMTRRAMAGNPALAGLLAELERGWERRDRGEEGMAETKYPTAAVRVPVPVHAKLTQMARMLSDERGRPVTLGEVIEELLEER